MRVHGPRPQETPHAQDVRAEGTREVARARAPGAVDTFDSNRVSRDPAVAEEKGFFGRIFSAIGNFFSSLWNFITGKGWTPSTSEKAPRRESESPSHRESRRIRQVTSPESSLRRVATSATAPSPRVGTAARYRSADEITGNTERVASGATFGGVPIRGVGQWYTGAMGTAFGGALDPDDNGIGAFGHRPGPGGREGVAIPQRIMAELTGTNSKAVHQQYRVEVTNHTTGKTAVFDIVDRGPSESVWRREGKPVVDLTEGAVTQLGGSVVTNSRGQMISTTGLDNLSFRIIRGD